MYVSSSFLKPQNPERKSVGVIFFFSKQDFYVVEGGRIINILTRNTPVDYILRGYQCILEKST